MKIVSLIKAEIIMLIGELKEYSLNMIFYNLSLLILFIGIFYSFNDGIKKESLILLFGLITWQLSSSALNYMSYVVQDESLLGTLEQIFMTRTSIFSVFTSKIIVNLIFSIIKASFIFLICLFVFDAQNVFLELGLFNNLKILCLVLATVFSFYIMGLMFGGMALFFKRIDSVVQVISYMLLFFTNITIPINSLPEIIRPISYLVPISWEMDCIKMILENNIDKSFYANLIGLFISSVVFIVIGYLSFNKCISKAKNMGKLGQY